VRDFFDVKPVTDGQEAVKSRSTEKARKIDMLRISDRRSCASAGQRKSQPASCAQRSNVNLPSLPFDLAPPVFDLGSKLGKIHIGICSLNVLIWQAVLACGQYLASR
jgi:hypothetical protein